MQKLVLHIGLLTALQTTPVHAYIGPGAGAGTIAVVIGVIVSFILAFIAIIWYPLKRLFKSDKPSEKKTLSPQSEKTEKPQKIRSDTE